MNGGYRRLGARTGLLTWRATEGPGGLLKQDADDVAEVDPVEAVGGERSRGNVPVGGADLQPAVGVQHEV